MRRPERAGPPRRVGLAGAAALFLIVLVTTAHVGTLDTFYAGMAGPWRVQVTARPPGIVPGRAQVLIRVSPATATKVSVQAAQWDVGSDGAPPPDSAVRVPGSPGLWSAELWLMTSGSYALNVFVDGPPGVGAVKVPIASLATKRLAMQRPFAFVLLGLGLFLAVGLVSIIGAGVRESSLVPGAASEERAVRRARIAMVVSSVVLIAVLTGGWTWWSAVDRDYARGMYKPIHATSSMQSVNGGRVLRLALDDSTWIARRWTPLVPDHGKMMHLFLVREPALDAFAHLHPAVIDSSSFEAPLGSLPAGTYHVFADIVHESGLSQTITGRVSITAPGGAEPGLGDSDDALYVGGPSRGDTARLADGARLIWHRPAAFVTREDAPLRFSVIAADGTPVRLLPYMGMAGHLLVTRTDGTVFMHLHPMGSISTTSQQLLEAVERGDTVTGSPGGAMVRGSRRGPLRSVPRPILRPDTGTMPMTAIPAAAGELSFPFAFPEPGVYRIWVQVRREHGIETASFETNVQ